MKPPSPKYLPSIRRVPDTGFKARVSQYEIVFQDHFPYACLYHLKIVAHQCNLPPMKAHSSMTTLFAFGFIAVQMWLPLSYYLGEHEYDERFAWRMFSSVRMTRCDFEVYDGSDGGLQRLSLTKRNHIVWVNLAKRARLSVIDKLVAGLCESHHDIRVRLSCTVPNGPIIGLCRNRVDGDQDGTPDGYNRMIGCALESPSDCFLRDCPEGNVDTCYSRLCREEILEPDTNRCVSEADS